MAFSFPYPKLLASPRVSGQGCKSCVHRGYCPALYWFRRYGIEGRLIDDHNGIQCASWSNVISDQVKTEPTDDDLNEEEYMYIQGMGSEADRGGISDMSSGTNRKP